VLHVEVPGDLGQFSFEVTHQRVHIESVHMFDHVGNTLDVRFLSTRDGVRDRPPAMRCGTADGHSPVGGRRSSNATVARPPAVWYESTVTKSVRKIASTAG